MATQALVSTIIGIHAFLLFGIEGGEGSRFAPEQPIDPMFAMERADEVPSIQGSLPHGVPESAASWGVRTAIGAMICLFVHWIGLPAKDRVVRLFRPRSSVNAGLPLGSEWKSKNGQTRLVVSRFNPSHAMLTHSIKGEGQNRWELREIIPVSTDDCSTLITQAWCPEHAGKIGDVAIVRGPLNSLYLELTFSGHDFEKVVVELRRTRKNV